MCKPGQINEINSYKLKSIFMIHVSSSNRCGQKSVAIVEKILGAEGFFNLVVKVIIRISGRKLEPNKFKLEISDNCFNSVSNYQLETTNRSGGFTTS